MEGARTGSEFRTHEVANQPSPLADYDRNQNSNLLLVVDFGYGPKKVTDFDGAISWNGTRISRATMDAYLADAASKSPQPEIHVNPNRLANYDVVARVLADAQRLGATHIGFAGIDQYR